MQIAKRLFVVLMFLVGTGLVACTPNTPSVEPTPTLAAQSVVTPAPTSATATEATMPGTDELTEFLGFDLGLPEESTFQIFEPDGARVDLFLTSPEEVEELLKEAMAQAGFTALPVTPTPETRILPFVRGDTQLTIILMHTAPEEVGLLITKE